MRVDAKIGSLDDGRRPLHDNGHDNDHDYGDSGGGGGGGGSPSSRKKASER